MLKFKVGDKVKITSGKDKGREGQIEKLILKEARALVPGVNIYKKHVKGVPGQKGGIYEIPRPLPFSSLAIICPKCSKPTRIGFRLLSEGKVRICRKCKREIDKK
ncbi:MAG: 50S ribosomal protein L24 [Candidatus Woesebacteria bacterium GW2011_GWB1_39_12]|uniref:Large ribosomal subunit protein uL24 n=2 Tax=Candidatus Woeseibacteriota TaxID=1752722 RepID=A0A0G0MC05_9BACT|nr:MAG: 50S ribosomal protein L24 [Candidatus Woesebacteria bacterium GW2011_GWB1_39_12]KKQ97895.1 MAG: 50S ribosomal protein L24 [Candidatus Woesebacteria bacterium GW2011_GWA1_39_12]